MIRMAKTVAENRKALTAYYATERRLWAECCRADGIDPAALFVVFSDGNRLRPFHDQAARQLQEAVAAYQAGGYLPMPEPRRRIS